MKEEEKQKDVPIIDFDNFQKEDAMNEGPLHMGETIYDEKGQEVLHLCKRIPKEEKKQPENEATEKKPTFQVEKP